MIFKLYVRVAISLSLLAATVGMLSAADNDNDKDKNQDAASCARLPGFSALKAAIAEATQVTVAD